MHLHLHHNLQRRGPSVPLRQVLRPGNYCRHLVGAKPERRPALGQHDRAAQRQEGAAADPERHVLLDRARVNLEPAEIIERAVILGERLAQ